MDIAVQRDIEEQAEFEKSKHQRQESQSRAQHSRHLKEVLNLGGAPSEIQQQKPEPVPPNRKRRLDDDSVLGVEIFSARGGASKPTESDDEPDIVCLPLYSALDPEQQMAVFEHKQGDTRRRFIFSTNIAETSVTVPSLSQHLKLLSLHSHTLQISHLSSIQASLNARSCM